VDVLSVKERKALLIIGEDRKPSHQGLEGVGEERDRCRRIDVFPDRPIGFPFFDEAGDLTEHRHRADDLLIVGFEILPVGMGIEIGIEIIGEDEIRKVGFFVGEELIDDPQKLIGRRALKAGRKVPKYSLTLSMSSSWMR
jgi:hypothetical protein